MTHSFRFKLYTTILMIPLSIFDASFGTPNPNNMSKNGYHSHDGFYFSTEIGGGLGRGVYQSELDNGDYSTSSGLPYFQIAIGGAPIENLILSYQMVTQIPSEENNEYERVYDTPREEIAQGLIMPAGFLVKYYLMPFNVFASATVGVGVYPSSSTIGGLLQFGIGKEWWVNDNIGIGGSVIYNRGSSGYESLDDYGNYGQSFVGVSFTFTYN